jgi:hypothetical protein
MNNYSSDSRVNNPGLSFPLEPNYFNPSNPGVPQPCEYDYLSTHISQPFGYPGSSPVYPIASPVFPVSPVEHPGYQTAPNPGPFYYNQQQTLIIPGRRNLFRCASSTLFLILIILELGLLIASLFSPWFYYCYFLFGLQKEYKSIDKSIKKGDGTNSLDDFYDDVCKPDEDYFEYCPHFCRSIKEVRHSSKIMFGFAIVVVTLTGLTILLIFVKLKIKRAKIPRVLFFIFPSLSFVLYLVGFIVYYETSKFSSFSYTKTDWDNLDHDPNNFGWSFGLVLAIPIFLLQFILASLSKNLVSTLYN